MKVRKAVIVAAGLGTRMLPASKVIPKEILPVVDKPAIQMVVEEAVASGIEEIILVLSPGRTTVSDISSRRRNSNVTRTARASMICSIGPLLPMILARFTVAFQHEPLGLGHAVLQAREAVGDEPFAAILPDDIFDGPRPCLRQFLDIAENEDAPVVALTARPAQRNPEVRHRRGQGGAAATA